MDSTRKKFVGLALWQAKPFKTLDLVHDYACVYITTPSCNTTICMCLYVTGTGKRAHLAQVINFQFIALSERAFFVLSNAL